MTKMTTMAINNKNLKKSSSSEPESLCFLKLGTKHLGMEVYKICINHDPVMTLTYFTARQLSLLMLWNWENC